MNETVKSLYAEYLKSQSPHESCLCDSCGRIYSHPINYCVSCPGKIVRAKLVVLDRIKYTLKSQHMLSDYLYGFGEFYKARTGEPFAYETFSYPSWNYYDLTNVLRELLGRPQVDLDTVNNSPDN